MDINRIRSRIDQHFKDKKEEYLRTKRRKHNKLYDKYYQSNDWYNLRNAYFFEHPCCEICEADGIVTPAEDVHHIHPWSHGITEEAKWSLLLNPNNLMSLCKHHHLLVHEIMREKELESVSVDTVLKYEAESNKRLALINNPVDK